MNQIRMHDEHTIVFQTGRLYTSDGQIIVARLDGDDAVIFCDVSRMIDGRISGLTELTRVAILAKYDAGEYSHGLGFKLRTELQNIADIYVPEISVNA